MGLGCPRDSTGAWLQGQGHHQLFLAPKPFPAPGIQYFSVPAQAIHSYIQLSSRAQHPRPRNTGEVGSESFNFIWGSFLEGSKVFLINNNTLAGTVLADGSWWILPEDSELDKRSLQVHVRGSAVPGVQTRSYQGIIAAGEIWSLSDAQLSPVTAWLLPGCWGKSPVGLLVVCEWGSLSVLPPPLKAWLKPIQRSKVEMKDKILVQCSSLNIVSEREGKDL